MHLFKTLTLMIALLVLSACDSAPDLPDNDLKVVIIRHGEKPSDGDNLSCQGQNRAMQLANVLYQKLKLPDFIYVPSLGRDKTTSHSRMFQTITPFLVKYNLNVNSRYEEDDYKGVADSVLKKKGTVLIVWSHQSIPKLAKALGIKKAPDWRGADFDSIWLISYHNGKAQLTLDKEGLNPPSTCNY